MGHQWVYLTRHDWGANYVYPRLGYAVPRDHRTRLIIHHTVMIDPDSTPNVWESLDEVKANMRRLQTIRPDLGLDVPYNFVAYLLSDGRVAFCEGRGLDYSGAHTAGFADGERLNYAGIAIAFAGDFEYRPIDLTRWLVPIQDFLSLLKRFLPNLGTRSICGRFACGHKDYSRGTACPGGYLYRVLDKFIPIREEDQPMTPKEREEFEQLKKDVQELKNRLAAAGIFSAISAAALKGEKASRGDAGAAKALLG